MATQGESSFLAFDHERLVLRTDFAVALSPDAHFPAEAISGSDPVVAPDGTAFVFWADFVPATATNARGSASCSRNQRDAGAHWSAPAAVARLARALRSLRSFRSFPA